MGAPRSVAFARYKPADDAERAEFLKRWCCKCARDVPMNSGRRFEDCAPHEVCPIISAAYTLPVTDPSYPREWRLDRDGAPMCSAFVPVGEQPQPLGRCPHTGELF